MNILENNSLLMFDDMANQGTVQNHVIRSDKMADYLKKEKEWTFYEVVALIEQYEMYPCLYNTRVKEYKDKEKRRKALEQIAAIFATTADEVHKKFSRLRIQYNRERAKLPAFVNGQLSAEDRQKAKITWVHFEALDFLRDFCISKSIRTNLQTQAQDDADPEENIQIHFDQEVDGDSTDSKPIRTEEDTSLQVKQNNVALKQQPTRKRSRRQDFEEDDPDRTPSASDTVTTSQVRSDSSADDLFGQYVASELKEIKDEYLKKLIKHKIQTVLFETQLSSLTPGAHESSFTVPQPTERGVFLPE